MQRARQVHGRSPWTSCARRSAATRCSTAIARGHVRRHQAPRRRRQGPRRRRRTRGRLPQPGHRRCEAPGGPTQTAEEAGETPFSPPNRSCLLRRSRRQRLCRDPAQSLSHSPQDRRRRHGYGVPGPGRTAAPRCRREGSAFSGSGLDRSRLLQAYCAKSAWPPRCGIRTCARSTMSAKTRACPGHGARRRLVPGSGTTSSRSSIRGRRTRRAADGANRSGPGSGPCLRHYSPRSETGQHPPGPTRAGVARPPRTAGGDLGGAVDVQLAGLHVDFPDPGVVWASGSRCGIGQPGVAVAGAAIVEPAKIRRKAPAAISGSPYKRARATFALRRSLRRELADGMITVAVIPHRRARAPRQPLQHAALLPVPRVGFAELIHLSPSSRSTMPTWI